MASNGAVRKQGRKAQSRWFWASSSLAFIAVCWSSACGGTSSETVVNPGAAGEPAAACELGETRECVGRGACHGGQQCTMAGWSACDCGDAAIGGNPAAATGGASDGGA